MEIMGMKTLWWRSIVVGTLGAVSGCDDDDDGTSGGDACRFDPEVCVGAHGALCRVDEDCGGGLFCCTERANCGGGMCTASCKNDRDCPGDMLCEHDKCFYACDSDRDCAEEMSCEHGNTVCEYK